MYTRWVIGDTDKCIPDHVSPRISQARAGRATSSRPLLLRTSLDHLSKTFTKTKTCYANGTHLAESCSTMHDDAKQPHEDVIAATRHSKPRRVFHRHRMFNNCGCGSRAPSVGRQATNGVYGMYELLLVVASALRGSAML
nr:hypothetical protein CFP56_44278 [Quercus suber]